MTTLATLQQRQAKRIAQGEKFWGYLDTEALQSRYALAAHFLEPFNIIVEIGGYRKDISDYIGSRHRQIIVYSMDIEFMPMSTPKINKIRGDFINHKPPEQEFVLLILGLDMDNSKALVQWAKQAKRIVVECAMAHLLARQVITELLTIPHKEIAYINFDFRQNQEVLNTPSIIKVPSENLIRSMYVLEPLP